jgi:hypothetical protein
MLPTSRGRCRLFNSLLVTSTNTASASTPLATLLDSLLGSSSEEGDGSSGDDDDVNTKVGK